MAGVGCNNILLVKVGGSSITRKAELETLDAESLAWFSTTIRSIVNDRFLDDAAGNVVETSTEFDCEKPSIVVVHGAGSFGHHTAKKHGLGGKSSPPPDGMNLTRDLVTGIARTRQSVKKLNGAVVSHLIENGVNAVGISPCLNVPGLMTHGGDEYNGVTVLVQSIRETLSAGLVPVIHGDAGLYGTYRDPSARDRFQSMSAGILGGDTLVEIIATHPLIRRKISKAIFLTDVNGVYTKDPKVFQDAVLVKNIFIDPVSGDVMNEVSASGSQHEHDVTGGLEGKLCAAANVAKTGIPVVVAKCGSPDVLDAMGTTGLDARAQNTCGNTLIRNYHRP